MTAGILCALLLPGAARAEALQPLRDGVPLSTAAAPANELHWSEQAGDVPAGGTPISPGKAVLYSLLLPGLGDYKLGNTGRATAFFAAEGLIWISFAVFEVQGRQREEEYEELAVLFAGVTRTGHSDEFYARLREYDNSDAYEADVKFDGRIELSGDGLYPDRINAEALDRYFAENRVEDFEPWQWSSHDRLLQYSEVRSSSKTSYRRADYMLAAAAANRVVSAIVAYASARSLQKTQDVGYRLDFTPAAQGVDLSVSFTRSF
jgi:hypothetical protein